MAVCSVVYEPLRESIEIEEDNGGSDDDSGDDLSDGEAEDFNWTEESDGTPEIALDIRTPIRKVNKIVNMFRKSPKLWEKLMKRTEDEHTCDDHKHVRLGLKKQCRTRWSSMFIMLERFYHIRD